MNRFSKSLLIAVALVAPLAASGCATRSTPGPERAVSEGSGAALVGRTRVFLDAYARNDRTAVLGMLDPDGAAVYGSDLAEFYTTTGQFSGMLERDFQLWGSARFGEMREVTVRTSGDLGAVFFNVPFSAGGRPEIQVRFATTWRRTADGWLLTQSSNAVPTVGSSAEDLLRRGRR